MKNFKPAADVPRHIYMKGKEGQGIFYRTEDLLYFLTLFCCLARKYHVTVMGVCPMFNHIHYLARFPDTQTLVPFQSHLAKSFVKEYNGEYGRTGTLFQHPYGQAPKQTTKKVRSCLAYVNNNPVAGKLCVKAQDYRWNLMGYCDRCYPFSKGIKRETASPSVRRALSLVDYAHSHNKPLNYALQRQILATLNQEGRNSMTDYILSQYNCLAYSEWEHLFQTVERAFLAIESNTGSEYDLPEDWEDYSRYREMLRIAQPFLMGGKGIDALSTKEKSELALKIGCSVNAPQRQIEKFLHQPGG